jgi:pimeloyl-ACP methyl ester carboxylesterase
MRRSVLIVGIPASTYFRSSSPALSDEAVRHLMRQSLRTACDGRLSWKYDPAVLEHSAPEDAYSLEQRWRMWSKLSCPTLIIRGWASDVLAPSAVDRMLHEHALATLVTVDSGHNVVVEAPDEMAIAIRDWHVANQR